jgi:hypothetical protein
LLLASRLGTSLGTEPAKWNKTFDREHAKRFQGIFANQNIVCLMRDTATADFLRKEFGVAS